MGKFVIECPVCGRYSEASTGIFGLFGTRKIDCTCGNTIRVKTDKMASKTCAHCGNTVIFDQSKGEEAVCPVCKEKINTTEDKKRLVDFSCPSCSCRLSADRSAVRYVCPLCETKIDVQEQVAKEKIKNAGAVSVIKYEGPNDVFIWKHPIEDFNLGSQLIVHESQEAIFFKDGRALDLFGPGRYTLATQNLPILEELYKLPTNTDEVFHSEIYFINRTVQMAIKWGTPDKVRFIDPLTGTPLELGASGEMNLAVDNGRKLLVKLVGTMKGISWEDSPGFTKSLQASFRPLISNAVKTNLPAAIKANEIDLLEIDEKLDQISEALISKIRPGFEEYGLTIPQFYVNNVVLPENDPNFKRIRELHTVVLQTRIYQAEATVLTAKAASETQYRTAQEQSKAAIEAARRGAVLEQQTTQTEVARSEAERRVIAAQAEAQAARMAGLTEAEIMAAKGYTQKDVLQAEVQKAYAEGIGNMGPAIAAGGGSSGILGDMLGLGVGMAAAQTIAPQIGNMMQNMQPGMQQPGAPAPAAPSGWDCPNCGTKNIQSRFCPGCGGPKPQEEPKTGWTCPNCGTKNIQSKFCPECGGPKPQEEPKTGWTCPNCGTKNIQSKFCPECGSPKPAAPAAWICPVCGAKEITTKFCPECGNPKPAEQPKTGWDCPNCGTKNIESKFCPECGQTKPENKG